MTINLAGQPREISNLKLIRHSNQIKEIVIEQNRSQLYINGKKIVARNDHLSQLATDVELNATAMEHLLSQPELIPEEWKSLPCIMFWGSEYEHCGHLAIRAIYWNRTSEEWQETLKVDYLDDPSAVLE